MSLVLPQKFKFRGEFDNENESDSLWTPLYYWWVQSDGPAKALAKNGIVHAEITPGDCTMYEITVATAPYSGRPLALSVFSPYNLCATLPLVDNYATPGVNEYALGKMRNSGRGINRHHRCARLLISRIAGLASDTLASRSR